MSPPTIESKPSEFLIRVQITAKDEDIIVIGEENKIRVIASDKASDVEKHDWKFGMKIKTYVDQTIELPQEINPRKIDFVYFSGWLEITVAKVKSKW
jgi:HSP20 family molecular chaperone IbpA